MTGERTPEDHEFWIRTNVEASKHNPSYGEAAAGWAVAEVDRLRARVAELETAGDRVVDLVDGESDLPGAVRDVVDDLRRAVRGER